MQAATVEAEKEELYQTSQICCVPTCEQSLQDGSWQSKDDYLLVDDKQGDCAAHDLTWPGPGTHFIEQAYAGQAPQVVEDHHDGGGL